ncbi:MAG: hypothetical protein ABIH18_08645 [Candidatus Omnitrophota bacterium]
MKQSLKTTVNKGNRLKVSIPGKAKHKVVIVKQGVPKIKIISPKTGIEQKFIKVKEKEIAYPPGYIRTRTGIIIPEGIGEPVPASKFRNGFLKAKEEIELLINDVVKTMKTEYAIKEIELAVSFNAEGKFLGFGIGGAASMKIKVAP